MEKTAVSIISITMALGTAGFVMSFFWRAILLLILEIFWVLQNTVYALVGLGDFTPANVNFFLSLFLDIVNTDIYFAETMSKEIFHNFTETEPYNDQIESIGLESKNAILNAGLLFYIVSF